MKKEKMSNDYQVIFNFKTQEFSATTVNAVDPDEAEQFAREYIAETYPEAFDIEIETVRVLN